MHPIHQNNSRNSTTPYTSLDRERNRRYDLSTTAAAYHREIRNVGKENKRKGDKEASQLTYKAPGSAIVSWVVTFLTTICDVTGKQVLFLKLGSPLHHSIKTHHVLCEGISYTITHAQSFSFDCGFPVVLDLVMNLTCTYKNNCAIVNNTTGELGTTEVCKAEHFPVVRRFLSFFELKGKNWNRCVGLIIHLLSTMSYKQKPKKLSDIMDHVMKSTPKMTNQSVCMDVQQFFWKTAGQGNDLKYHLHDEHSNLYRVKLVSKTTGAVGSKVGDTEKCLSDYVNSLSERYEGAIKPKIKDFELHTSHQLNSPLAEITYHWSTQRDLRFVQTHFNSSSGELKPLNADDNKLFDQLVQRAHNMLPYFSSMHKFTSDNAHHLTQKSFWV